MKKPQHSSFKFSPIATAVAIAITSQFIGNIASAGTGYGSGLTVANTPVAVPTYYANSPSGPIPTYSGSGAAATQNIRTDGSGLPITATSGTLLRKFVDTLPGFGAAKANNLGLYIPVATPEKWTDPNGIATTDDYYEIAAVEFTQQMHSDLPKATRLRGYVQIATPGAIAAAKASNATYAGPFSFTTLDGQVLSVIDLPHHLGPVITATQGTTVRVKFTNYLPVGGKMFLPYDETLPGAGTSAAVDPVTKLPLKYTQNRAGMHLVGGQAPWISAGSPHQWIAPAGEAAAYAAGIGKGASAQSAPDMIDPGNGSVNLVFPNDMSARFTFFQDRTSGMTRLNAYAGLESAYVITDPIEQGLVTSGVIPADQIPLIIEDKTFVPSNVAQQDALWNDPNWGVSGDLWFPHVYEPNQNPGQTGGANPVGRWDYGPLFWPIFPVHPAKATLPSPSFVPEAYFDTPVINGVAYPTTTVDPKAYRMRILNSSNDRYINLGLYVAAPDLVNGAPTAPLLDANGNPIINLDGTPQYLSGTEVKMVPAAPIDTLGSPPGWDPVAGVQLPLPQFAAAKDLAGNPLLPWNINAEPSGPTRAWPVDGRAGGVPDPTTSGPDFVVIGNDGGLLPHAVDIPPQPVTYEQNRRSITVTNIYGYGLLLGPSERADTIVDFSAYAGKTLILYNDAPAPTPFNDQRNDYYTGNPDLSGQGGAYSTLPGYGPNTRTMMQIKVNATNTSGTGGTLDPVKLATALPAAYGASQPAPVVPEVAYNAAFNTTDTDNYARVATGSNAQPYLTVNTTGALTLMGITPVSSGGAGSGSGSGYATAPNVILTNAPGDTGTGATATASINAAGQVSAVTLTNAGAGYKTAPIVTFVPNNSISGAVINKGGVGYAAPVTVTLSGGGLNAPTVVPASVVLSIAGVSTALAPSPIAPVITVPGSGYLVPPKVTFSAPTGTVTSGAPVTATGTATIKTTSVFKGSAVLVVAGSGYTSANPKVTLSAPQNTGTTATATATVGFALSSAFNYTPAAGFGTKAAPATVVVSAPDLAGGAQAAVKLAVNATTGQVTGITLDSANPGSGYTKAATVTLTDSTTNTSAQTTIALGAGTGKVFDVVVTNGGAGYTAAPTVTIADVGGTGTGASATLALSEVAGYVTGLTVSNAGSGYAAQPTVTFTDVTPVSASHALASPASATVSLSTAPGAIVSISGIGMPAATAFANSVAGFTGTPLVSLQGANATGSGADVTVGIAPVGVGAQATVQTSTTLSIPVLTKAEQELFDDFGRYNSTGGVELPFTTANVQTTIPLNYIDQPTEILGENEAQIWKLVDNGLWTNSIHFSGWDVQLLNRVGWDGTVKAPATNEVGWKVTLRLNPLEDAIVAMRAKSPKTLAFGLPQSTRLLDPSKPAGTGNYPTAPAVAVAGTQYEQGLGFTADRNVVTQAGTMNSLKVGVGKVLLATSTNTAGLAGSTTGNFDNEFIWGSAILGHSEDDLTRPVVFNPLVSRPAAPQGLADVAVNGTLTWIDPTPAATSKGNPQNEIGFKIKQAPITSLKTYKTGMYTTFATVPANVVSFKEPAALVAPNLPTYYAYQVVAYNAAGDSGVVNTVFEAPPQAATPNQLTGYLSASAMNPLNASTFADVQANLNWVDNAINETSYSVTRTGGPGATLAGGKVTGGTVTTIPLLANSTTFTDAGLIEGAPYQYDVIASNTFGNSTALSQSVTAPNYQPPAQIAGLKSTLVSGNIYNLSWTMPTAPNWTSFTLNGILTSGATTTVNTGKTASRQVSLAVGNNYSYTVTASNTYTNPTTGATGNAGTSVPSAAVTINMLPALNTAIAVAVVSSPAKGINVTWTNTSSNLLTPLSGAVAPALNGFTVQRRTSAIAAAGGKPAVAAGIFANITPAISANGTAYSFTDTTGTTGVAYDYRVFATSLAGNSAPSAVVKATAP